jgi:hypothetical protein
MIVFEIYIHLPLSLSNKTNLFFDEIIATLLHNQTPPPQPAQPQPPNVVAPRNNNVQIHEMNIPNDLIGCIIGRGGQKISEIR